MVQASIDFLQVSTIVEILWFQWFKQALTSYKFQPFSVNIQYDITIASESAVSNKIIYWSVILSWNFQFSVLEIWQNNIDHPSLYTCVFKVWKYTCLSGEEQLIQDVESPIQPQIS